MAKKKTIENISSTIENDNNQFVTVTESDFFPSENEEAVSAFSFGDSSKPVPNATKSNNSLDYNFDQSENDIDSQNGSDLETTFFTQKVRGLTPRRDDEAFDIKRCYQFRASTIKKLNLIKCNSKDTNIYLNEVLDDAICYYYDSFFK